VNAAKYLDIQRQLLAAAAVLARLDLMAFSQAHDAQPLADQTEQTRVARRLCRWAQALRGEYLAALRAEMGGAAELAGLTNEEVLDLSEPVFGRRTA